MSAIKYWKPQSYKIEILHKWEANYTVNAIYIHTILHLLRQRNLICQGDCPQCHRIHQQWDQGCLLTAHLLRSNLIQFPTLGSPPLQQYQLSQILSKQTNTIVITQTNKHEPTLSLSASICSWNVSIVMQFKRLASSQRRWLKHCRLPIEASLKKQFLSMVRPTIVSLQVYSPRRWDWTTSWSQKPSPTQN